MAVGTLTPPDAALKRNGINQLALVAVWLTVALSGIVFAEPAPVDALMFGLIVMLPVVGLFALRTGVVLVAVVLTVISASALISATLIVDDFSVAAPNGSNFQKGAIHTLITIYLLAGAAILTGFIALRPFAHSRLIFGGLLFAATLAAITGVIGYFGIGPGTTELFTKFGRAAGTFKDPNVLGAFLVLPFLAAAGMVLHGRAGMKLLGLAVGGLILLAILLTFSRGAYVMTAVGLSVFAFLAFTTARSYRQRVQMVLLFMVAMFAAMSVIGAALSSPDIAEFFTQRAQATQSYDTGPEGRFGGQAKAVDVLLDNPLGIGAQAFVPRYHGENPHNVYLITFLKAGWVGGFLYALLVLFTLLFGFGYAIKRTAHQHLFQVAYAGFVALAVIGLFIDTDHWRHFFVNAALVWGMMAAPQRRASRIAERPRYKRGARITGYSLNRNISPVRDATIVGPARRRLRRAIASRRQRDWHPRRPQRIAYLAANDA